MEKESDKPLERDEVEDRVAKMESFSEQMVGDLEIAVRIRQSYQAKVKAYSDFQASLLTMQDIPEETPLVVLHDIGSGMMVEAAGTKRDTVFMDVGGEIFLRYSVSEAYFESDRLIEKFEKRIEEQTKKIASIKSSISVIGALTGQLQETIG
ncbi:Prefoldin alpha-like protein [Aduncisulcus paluster]|uniref:Prefoldin alpha-like protein n=1 Tax=Aduncisulcus paluster TaxID=2918883 RepID=A0ABQ5KTE4_9EUKA|nr:Prefoldin alpha-like protein [Aduncisulcus paluster]|eukprot:gnl/Carplike_NY0171/6540_a8982_273.p1 GENE.gnl/Carplike_NY0171/6540_a8982_273~~gnl/Carplike_NY0171/6540_a8982_273.p1  ORF type:complete len:152 (-),score=27.39 gnl/Carplike_NY0171/6540_a8982_273:198-653(-)